MNNINVQCSLLGNLWVLEEQKADFTLTRTYLITASDQTHPPIAAVSQHNACILKKNCSGTAGGTQQRVQDIDSAS